MTAILHQKEILRGISIYVDRELKRYNAIPQVHKLILNRDT